MNIKMNFQKINDFRNSLRYRPWGIIVGVSVSNPTRAVAQLLGESRAYGDDDADDDDNVDDGFDSNMHWFIILMTSWNAALLSFDIVRADRF